MKRDEILIIGAGLVGSLLSILLSKRGFLVTVIEKRNDPRKQRLAEGRSINLALSHRGIRSLKLAGVYELVASELIPMHSRLIHQVKEASLEQPYGLPGQHINSVSRNGLNKILIEAAEKAGVVFQFDKSIVEKDLATLLLGYDLVVGADGSNSILRPYVLGSAGTFAEQTLAHGYKELNIPPSPSADFQLAPNHLHIWPRGDFMLIALPNPDKSFTATLFCAKQGEDSFDHLTEENQIDSFFKKYFPGAKALISDLADQFQANPVGQLTTIRCSPWVRDKCLLIGDAAHAIVPFYGQGMNAGFEDCRILIEIAEKNAFDWSKSLGEYASSRKVDTDAIATLAIRNYEEMRDHVANDRFLAQKALERSLQDRFPDKWLPLYSMVTFSDLPYSEALRLGDIQQAVLDKYADLKSLSAIDEEKIVGEFNNRALNEQKAPQ